MDLCSLVFSCENKCYLCIHERALWNVFNAPEWDGMDPSFPHLTGGPLSPDFSGNPLHLWVVVL